MSEVEGRKSSKKSSKKLNKNGSRRVLHSMDKVMNSPSGTASLLSNSEADNSDEPDSAPRMKKKKSITKKQVHEKIKSTAIQVKTTGKKLKKTLSGSSVGSQESASEEGGDVSSPRPGDLLRRGLKFTSQDAVMRFISMPGKIKRAGKKRKSSNDENLEDMIGSDNPSFNSTMSEEDTPSTPPPRKKKKNIAGGSSTVDATHPRFNKEKLKEMLAKADTPKNCPNKEQRSFMDKAKDRLTASRFRYLNEQLYTQTSAESVTMFKEDKSLFTAYHQGFQQQANAWPCDPLDRIIAACLHLPDEHVVVDMGCGEARLARSIPNKVHSFDLVAMAPEVVECDMSRVPLKNSSVQVVVFSLSLMGTNIKDFLAEAGRLLEIGGILKIAELESRFQGQENQFIRDVEKYGFELSWKDLKSQYFYFFDFKKVKDKTNRKKMPAIQLKPCLYKKR